MDFSNTKTTSTNTHQKSESPQNIHPESRTLQLTPEIKQNYSLFVATPMYGGMCYGTYAESMISLITHASLSGLKIVHHFIMNESLIQRARAYCVDEFMRSGCTHMLFVDSDISFSAKDALYMFLLQIEDKLDVVGAAYPKKMIAYEKVKAAVNRGLADNNPEELANYIGDYVVNPIFVDNKPVPIHLLKPTEVAELGTGFMMFSRDTIQKFEEAYPELRYRPDHVRTEHFNGKREIYMYFDSIIDPVSKRYLSEDYLFCQKCREAGMKIWLLPWIQLKHTGTHVYGGSIAHMAQIGASVASDGSAVGGSKKFPEMALPQKK